MAALTQKLMTRMVYNGKVVWYVYKVSEVGPRGATAKKARNEACHLADQDAFVVEGGGLNSLHPWRITHVSP